MLPDFTEEDALIRAPLGMDFVRAWESSLERGFRDALATSSGGRTQHARLKLPIG